MGEARNEIRRLQENGDHLARWTVAPPGALDAGEIRHSTSDLLPLAWPIPYRRAFGQSVHDELPVDCGEDLRELLRMRHQCIAADTQRAASSLRQVTTRRW